MQLARANWLTKDYAPTPNIFGVRGKKHMLQTLSWYRMKVANGVLQCLKVVLHLHFVGVARHWKMRKSTIWYLMDLGEGLYYLIADVLKFGAFKPLLLGAGHQAV